MLQDSRGDKNCSFTLTLTTMVCVLFFPQCSLLSAALNGLHLGHLCIHKPSSLSLVGLQLFLSNLLRLLYLSQAHGRCWRLHIYLIVTSLSKIRDRDWSYTRHVTCTYNTNMIHAPRAHDEKNGSLCMCGSFLVQTQY